MLVLITLIFIFFDQSYAMQKIDCTLYDGFWKSSSDPEFGLVIKQTSCDHLKITRTGGDYETLIKLDGKWSCGPSILSGGSYCYRGLYIEKEHLLVSFSEGNKNSLKAEDWRSKGPVTLLHQRTAIYSDKKLPVSFESIYTKK
jgi:hypothetical protein